MDYHLLKSQKMGNSLAKVIHFGADAYAKGRAQLPKKLGNEAINHFKDNWRKQGFDDNTVAPWKKRKNNLDPGRAILVGKGYGAGRLRRSFNSVVQNSRRVLVINDTPYSVYHNYGTKRLPQRKFMGRSRNLDEKSGVLIMRMMKAALR